MIIQNAVKIIEDGVEFYLISTHRHHFNQYTFKNGATYFVDGGKDYFRAGHSNNIPDDAIIVGCHLDDGSSIEEIRNKLLWGHYPLKPTPKSCGIIYTPIKDLSLDHLKNIVKDFEKRPAMISKIHLDVIKYWIKEKSKG